jgi:hypothetical protein
MSDYWVTFRIESDATYDKRYKGLVEAMALARGSNASWGEPTSFWLVRTHLDIDAFTKALSKPLNATTDLLVVRELAVDDSRYFGAIKFPDVLKTFLPKVKKVP